jgi:glycosyltransferase involved in cell wall biosynthesis
MTNYPKITIVTPNYNLGAYLEQTILSVLNQNYPNLEYVIIDGGSTDNSIDIIKKYEKELTYWISESDNGMYEAIQKGFDRSTGEIMGWLNSDDMLVPNGLFTLAEVFSTFPAVNWVQGRPSSWDEKGRLIDIGMLKRWNKYHFYIGKYQWIQQESTYWTRKIWEKSGGKLNTGLKLAGDFELWLRFFGYEKLYTVSALIGGFRFRKEQLSKSNEQEYLKEVKNSLAKVKGGFSLSQHIKTFIFRLFFILIQIGCRLQIRYDKLDAFFIGNIFNSPKLIHYNKIKQRFERIKYRP